MVPGLREPQHRRDRHRVEFGRPDHRDALHTFLGGYPFGLKGRGRAAGYRACCVIPPQDGYRESPSQCGA
ncbi:hypothetical protein D3C84_1107500 [compost metagenome]